MIEGAEALVGGDVSSGSACIVRDARVFWYLLA